MKPSWAIAVMLLAGGCSTARRCNIVNANQSVFYYYVDGDKEECGEYEPWFDGQFIAWTRDPIRQLHSHHFATAQDARNYVEQDCKPKEPTK